MFLSRDNVLFQKLPLLVIAPQGSRIYRRFFKNDLVVVDVNPIVKEVIA